jgi:predicted enzyme related to lactoylglutathione lyase
MIELKRFSSIITFCYTGNMEASHEFYSGVLKLPMVLDQGGCRIYRVSGAGYIGFCSRKVPEPSGSVTITLVTDDVDHWFEEVKNAGCEVIKPPAFTPEYNIYNCFVREPSGYTLEIQRFEDPRWPPKE